MRRAALIVLLLVMLVTLTACHSLDAGEVIKKGHHSSWTQVIPIVISNGKSSHVTNTFVFHPEEWTVTVQNGDDKDVWNVKKEFWESVRIGDWVTR